VLPLVPELLRVPAEPPVLLPEGRVEVEPPEAPMPEVLPEDEVPPVLGLDEADEEPEGLMVPEAEPPDEPMPEAVPVALPEPEVPQAARAAVQAIARTYFIICLVPFRSSGAGHVPAPQRTLPAGSCGRKYQLPGIRVGPCAARLYAIAYVNAQPHLRRDRGATSVSSRFAVRCRGGG
jgi:hypothetical protein